jgi:Acyl-CoA dehydrogenase, N-terminal domain
MTNAQAKLTEKPGYTPPPIDGDFYRIASVLNNEQRALLGRVRAFTEGVVAPVIEDYWGRDEFPFAIIPKMAEIGIGGIGYQGYGAAGGSWLLNGFVAMELARMDASVATFWGVPTGLSAGMSRTDRTPAASAAESANNSCSGWNGSQREGRHGAHARFCRQARVRLWRHHGNQVWHRRNLRQA